MSDFKELIKPFVSLKEFLQAVFILVNYSRYSIQTITNLINCTQKQKFTITEIENLNIRINCYPDIYAKSFFQDMSDFKDKIDSLLTEEHVIHFETEALNCVFCTGKINGKKQSYNAICYFYASPPKKAIINSKSCSSCGAVHFINYAELKSPDGIKREAFPNILLNKYISFTHETIFERLVLDSFTADLLYKYSSFQAFTNAYNHLFKCKEDYITMNDKVNRSCLQEPRLTEAWLFYQYLKTFKEINVNVLCPFPHVKDLNQTIRLLKPSLLPYFTNKWSSKIF